MANTRQASSKKNQLETSDFVDHPEVRKCLDKLRDVFNGSGRPFLVSDVIDADGNQYVNLVQKGGGVLGVSLVGYTYILEKMGIRFLRLAGTSAGAINTALMTVIGNKESAKSEKIVYALSQLDFFSLVDGHPAARWIIKRFITKKRFTQNSKKIMGILASIGGLLLLADFITLGLADHYSAAAMLAPLFFVLTGIYFSILGFSVFYLQRLLRRLKNSGFGINPGDQFYDWIKGQLRENGVNNVTELNQKASTLPPLTLRAENPESLDTLFGDVTFIASELVTQNKIQFPGMCNLFRKREDIDTLQPAGFIRASMAIPIFFESYFINKIPCHDEEIKQAWLEKFNENDPPSVARFVDGGILSNFPINIFYNPRVTVPRLPSFGIDLDDSKPDDEKNNAQMWSIGGYLGRMFNTIRFYYDKDFLLKNKMYEKGIGKVKLQGYNWLNFFISDKDKVDMFVKGAQAATEFLIDFDWHQYKEQRKIMQFNLDEPRKETTASSH